MIKYRHIFSGLSFLFVVVFLSSCDKDTSDQENNLNFISRTPVDVPEASGLAVFDSGHYLTVSDSISKIYLLDLNGNMIRTLGFSGKNLEGVTYDPSGPFIYVVEEKDNEIVKLDTTGQEISRFSVPLDNMNPQHGLEGISLDPANGLLYVISEKNPSLLFILSQDGALLQTHGLYFAEDYSSVYFDPQENVLWILSEDSGTLTKTTLQGSPLITYNTGIKKAEGVIVDSKSSRVYIITDSSSSLYTLSF